MTNFDILNLKEIVDEYKFVCNKKIIIPKGISVGIPVRNECPEKVIETFRLAIEANRLAVQRYEIKISPIDSIYLLDQSDKEIAEENRSLLEEIVSKTKKDFVKKGLENYFPNTRYLSMGNKMRDLILSKWTDIKQLKNLTDHIKEKNAISGKGLGMWKFTLTQKDKPLLFIDSDYRNRSVRQILALSLPLSHLNYDAIIGTFERYHENEFGEMYRGGRVNATTRALFDMISASSQMKEIGYPLCGDQGSTLEVLNNLAFPMKFGIETAMRIQFHSHVNGFNKPNHHPLLLYKKSLQVNIGGSDDAPIAEGESKDKVKRHISSMCEDIAKAFFASTSINFLNRWDSSNQFMEDFEIYQIRALKKYRDNCQMKYGII